ncbi:MAG TPA: Ig domain-containing protein [Kofleriaceae bacterium]|nr:Ig domain-containing protein [Kofleriaceae bacterium]
MGVAKALIVVGICACGGKPPPQPRVPPNGPGPTTAADRTPEFYPPAWTKVGVGQTVSFGTSVIDQDLDETSVTVAKMPASATFDAITQTITWTPTAADKPRGEFVLRVHQAKGDGERTFAIDVVDDPQLAPVAPPQSPIVETLLLVRQPDRLAQVNEVWPLDRLLEFGAATFVLQFKPEKRAQLTTPLDGKTAYEQFLTGLAETHANPRLDPKSPQFDRDAFGDPKSWKIVAFRPRIDKAWAELRVVYQAMRAKEPVFAMFRLRPVVEYVPALPRPEEERTANNQIFLGMVAKRLMRDGGPNPAFERDTAAHAKAVADLMTDVMTFDDTQGHATSKPYLHGFEIGIALEARMGGGSARNGDGTYKSGDGWGWSAMKPFQTGDGKGQRYQNVAIPGFWTETVPSDDKTTWVPKCAPRFDAKDPAHVAGYDVLCRKTMGFVDLPAMQDGQPINGRVDANNLYLEHKMKWSVEHLPLEDGRRDLGEENGMTCSQCHIRNFGMHDYGDPANVDPTKGTPRAPNHAIATLNFQIVPSRTGRWEAFTLEFLQHQECRGKMFITQYLGADAAKGLTCPLQK